LSPTETIPDYMTVSEAAGYTRHSKRFLDDARVGLRPGPRFLQRAKCCTVLYRKADLDQWLAGFLREKADPRTPRKRKAGRS